LKATEEERNLATEKDKNRAPQQRKYSRPLINLKPIRVSRTRE
jgi:hypothetical protein